MLGSGWNTGIPWNRPNDSTPRGDAGPSVRCLSRVPTPQENPMTPEQTRLAQRRLSLGITNVGFWVVASICGLTWISSGRRSIEGTEAVSLAAAAVGIQAVFDTLGGMVLMPGARPTTRAFLRQWGRGALVHMLTFATLGFVALLSLRWTGGFCAGMAVSILALALGRPFLHAAISGIQFRPSVGTYGERLLITRVDDPSFTGGLVGFGSRAAILIPEAWCQSLPGSELHIECSRRRWQAETGLPLRTLLIVLFWNLTGCLIGAQTFNLGSLPTGTALLGQACWMTLWSFLGLLVLPGLGRSAVFAADRALCARGLDPSPWIQRLPTLTGEDGNSRPWVETVFYPIPSVARRIESLRSPSRVPVLGDLARSQLFYSLAGLTLLGRAVHCNVGRPALWVFPPSA